MALEIGCGNDIVLSKIGQGNELRQKKCTPGWMDRWIDGWMEVKAVLRIAYSNKKQFK